VLSKAELKGILARVEHSTPEVKIDLDIQDRGKTWTVEAKARVDAAHATDTEGSGWIARRESGQQWYAARDLSGFNRQLIAETFQQLKKPPDTKPSDNPTGDDRAQYDRKVRQGAQLVDDMQRKLDGQIRGLKAKITMEPWSGVEQDHLIRTELRVTPNDTLDVDNIPSGSPLLPSVITFTSDNNGRASHALGMPLTRIAGNTTGSNTNNNKFPEWHLIDSHVTKSTHQRTYKDKNGDVYNTMEERAVGSEVLRMYMEGRIQGFIRAEDLTRYFGQPTE